MHHLPQHTPIISLIWGQDRNGLIGNGNRLPWKLPADMRWFREQTMGKPIWMGRKTYESIGHPLPGRKNIILSRQSDLQLDGCTAVCDIDSAIEASGNAEEAMIMGGAEIYALLLPLAKRLYITEIDATFQGDTWFPPLNLDAWKLKHGEHHLPDEKNRYPYTFKILERI